MPEGKTNHILKLYTVIGYPSAQDGIILPLWDYLLHFIPHAWSLTHMHTLALVICWEIWLESWDV